MKEIKRCMLIPEYMFKKLQRNRVWMNTSKSYSYRKCDVIVRLDISFFDIKLDKLLSLYHLSKFNQYENINFTN